MSRERFFSTFSPWRSGFLPVLLVALLGAAPLRADIEPGIFVMTTSTLEPTRLSFNLGPGFFGTGSDEVVLTELNLKGSPLDTEGGSRDLGQGDTVILTSDVDFLEDRPDPKTTNAQVLAISLESSQPLTVTYNGANPELWTLRICMTEAPPPSEMDSRIQFVNECLSTGGTFVAGLKFRPRLIFTRERDGQQQFLDAGTVSPPAYLSFNGHGHWMTRDSAPSGFVSVQDGAVRIDADCNSTLQTPSFETTLPETSNVILGLARVNCNTALPNQGFPAIEPVAVGPHYVLEPATQDDRALLKDSELPRTHSDRLAALGLSGLAFLGLAAVVIRPRRPPR